MSRWRVQLIARLWSGAVPGGQRHEGESVAIRRGRPRRVVVVGEDLHRGAVGEGECQRLAAVVQAPLKVPATGSPVPNTASKAGLGDQERRSPGASIDPAGKVKAMPSTKAVPVRSRVTDGLMFMSSMYSVDSSLPGGL